MKLQKIDESDALKSGQLLATPRKWRLLGSIAFPDCESGSWQYQFYQHRRDPVPGIKRSKRRRNFRHPKTANERRASFAAPKNREHLGDPDLAYTVRKKRSPCRLPDLYNDARIQYQRSWKEHRRQQHKKTNCTNRQIHSPPFGQRISYEEAQSKAPFSERANQSARALFFSHQWTRCLSSPWPF